MKRRLIFIVFVLIGGAILNVAVAIGFAQWGGRNLGGVVEPIESLTSTTIPSTCVSIYRSTRVAEIILAPFLGTQSELDQYLADNVSDLAESTVIPLWISGHRHLREIDARGWPCLALWCEYLDDNRIEGEMSVAGGIDFRWRSDRVRPLGFQSSLKKPAAIPIRPIWPGFAINTLFYSAILWLIFFLPFALRRRRRIKRGLCATCAYNLRGAANDSSNCPECGTQLPSPSR